MIVNCKTASALISQSFEQTLSLSDRIKVRIHLFLCQYVGGRDCENYQEQILMLRQLASQSGEKSLGLHDIEKLKLSFEHKKNMKKVMADFSRTMKRGKA